MQRDGERARSAGAAGAVALIMAACAAGSAGSADPAGPGGEAGVAKRSDPAKVKWTGTESEAALGDLPVVVRGNTAFALDLYARLGHEEPGNLFFSPASISTALAMTYAGARNQTEADMARTMHFELAQQQLHPAFAQLMKRLQAQPDKSELAIANRLWGEQSWRFLPAFLAITRDAYGAELESLDFKGDREGARKTINDWVSDHTRGRIRNLLLPPNVKPDTRLILTNAVYFKAPWQAPFEKEATRPAPFWLASGEQRDTPMMHQIDYAAYGEADGVEVLEKGYEGGALSMVVLLPEKRDGLAALEAKLDPALLDRLLASTKPQKVAVWLPKFKFEQRVQLAKTLKEMGMGLAFSDDADFSGMTGGRDMKIDDVIHKAFIAVYEEGTEAAAATAVVMAEITSAGPRPQPKQFRADHPFLFLIRDRATGTVLFMGRLVEPIGG